MATERQIAANSRNAANSTGPRSSGGRKRASQNAYRHGLAAHAAINPKLAKAVEKLARKLAGKNKNALVLECARAAARAELDLAQTRRIKVATIQRMLTFESPTSPADRKSNVESATTEAAPPPIEPERMAEAVRRALPDLVKLDRYEARAIARRVRAIRALVTI